VSSSIGGAAAGGVFSSGGVAVTGGSNSALGGNAYSTGGRLGTNNTGGASGGAGNGGTTAVTSGGKASGGAATGGLTAASGGTTGSKTTGGAAAGGTAGAATTKATGGLSAGGMVSGGNGSGGGATGGAATGGSTASTSPVLPKFIIGADISSVDEAIDSGSQFADTDGKTKSILEILKNHGFNFIRLRAFVKPGAKYGYAYGTGSNCIKRENYCDTAHTVAFAKQVKAAGMGLLLDLHYSDNWADPGNQIIPEDWRAVSTITQLAGDVQSYTKDIVGQLVSAGARPDIVQVGNEITSGMLADIPNSSTDCWGNNVSDASPEISGSTASWSNLGTLLKAGIAGIYLVDNTIKTMVHIENTKSSSAVVSWVKSARNQGVNMDIVGLSCYEAYQGDPSVWKAAFDALASNFSDLSFVIAEYNPRRTEANQVMYGMSGGRGLGTFIWEPTQSGDWGDSMFTWTDNFARANSTDFAEFDTIAKTVGLK
jgi:arabinogalactan endo-1,4-beta-galactosidase